MPSSFSLSSVCLPVKVLSSSGHLSGACNQSIIYLFFISVAQVCRYDLIPRTLHSLQTHKDIEKKVESCTSHIFQFRMMELF